MKRHNHYEAAFEDFLRSERLPYVAVNEQRRALDEKGSLKSVDFILSVEGQSDRPASFHRPALFNRPTQWLIDVKGRKFPSGNKQKQYWRNWTTRDELDSLERWTARFGPRCDAALVFAYWLVGDRSPVPVERVHYFRDEPYSFVAVRLADYLAAARTLSPRWGTVSVRVAEFRRLAQPLETLLLGEPMTVRG